MRRKACMIITLLAIVITSINVAYTLKDEFFYTLDDLPKGDFSRNDHNQNILFSSGISLDVYEIEATSRHPAAVRVEVKNDRSGEKRTIYWQIGTRESLIYWPEDQGNTVVINGVPIDYQSGSYDCRDYRGFEYVPQNEAKSNKF